jgi:hypothetical protein
MQLLRQLALIIAGMVLVSACKDKDRGYAIPVQSCAGFSFVAATDEEAASARKLMYASAIEFGLPFNDKSFLSPNAVILWASDKGDRLALTGFRDQFTKRTEYSVRFLIGGVDHYRHRIATCGRIPAQFERLRVVFAEKWNLRDLGE